MTIPIQKGHDIKLKHVNVTGPYQMHSAESYKDYYGIGYTYRGDRIITTPDKTLFVNGKCLCFIHKDLIHKTSSITENPYECTQIKITEELAKCLQHSIGSAQFEQLFTQIVYFFEGTAQKKIEQIIKNMEEEWKHFDEYSDKLLENLLYQLIVTCIREHSRKNFPKQRTAFSSQETQNLLKEAIRYVELHFRENPSLTETAQAVHISAPYLSKLFTDTLNTSYSEFLNTKKINHAQKLLLNTQMSMVDIAVECGFSNSHYFSDVFKKTMGISPLKYRKAFAKK